MRSIARKLLVVQGVACRGLAGESQIFQDDWQKQVSSPTKDVYLKPTSSKRHLPSIYFARDSSVLPPYCTKAPPLGVAAPLFKVTSHKLRVLLHALAPPQGWVQAHPGPRSQRAMQRVLGGKACRSSQSPTAQLCSLARTHLYQRINHFLHSHINLGCKSGMYDNIRTKRKECGDLFDIAPRTWRLPEDEQELHLELESHAGCQHKFIVKPARGSCGRGIQVAEGTAKLLQILEEHRYANPAMKLVVQHYIDNPLLVKNRKFDLRIYVGVSSIDPLVAYVHRGRLG